jgi:hypothetical protein
MCPIYAVVKPVYQPAMRIVTAITQSNPTTITTSFPHNYGTGLVVRIDIPPGFGMQQINQQVADIVVTGATTFTMPIDTTSYDPLVVPSTYREAAQQPQVVPVGEINDILTQATRNVLPLTLLIASIII